MAVDSNDSDVDCWVFFYTHRESKMMSLGKTMFCCSRMIDISTLCRVCGVFLIDSHFMVDGGKFISGAMAALSVMVNLEIPHVNILSKVLVK